MVQPCWKTLWQFHIKLKMYLLYDPAIQPLGIYPRKMKTYAHFSYTKDVYSSFIHNGFKL